MFLRNKIHTRHRLPHLAEYPTKINLPLVSHLRSRYPAIIGANPEYIRLAIANQHRSFMGKLSDAFFNYLRNRCL
jgi:hypothetical protein